MVGKKINNSIKLLKEAKKLIPTGSQTFSKGTHSFSENYSPSHALKGKGNKIYDVDGNKYLDFVMGAQPLILALQKSIVWDASNRKRISFENTLLEHFNCTYY